MKGLVSPDEIVRHPVTRQPFGIRVAEIKPNDQTFSVADPLFWQDCPDGYIETELYYDANEKIIKPIPNV